MARRSAAPPEPRRGKESMGPKRKKLTTLKKKILMVGEARRARGGDVEGLTVGGHVGAAGAYLSDSPLLAWLVCSCRIGCNSTPAA